MDALRYRMRAIPHLEHSIGAGNIQSWQRLGAVYHALSKSPALTFRQQMRWMNRSRGAYRKLLRLEPEGSRWQLETMRSRLGMIDLLHRRGSESGHLRGLRLMKTLHGVRDRIRVRESEKPGRQLEHRRLLAGASELMLSIQLKWAIDLEEFHATVQEYIGCLRLLLHHEPGSFEWTMKLGLAHSLVARFGMRIQDSKLIFGGQCAYVGHLLAMLNEPAFAKDPRVWNDLLLATHLLETCLTLLPAGEEPPTTFDPDTLKRAKSALTVRGLK